MLNLIPEFRRSRLVQSVALLLFAAVVAFGCSEGKVAGPDDEDQDIIDPGDGGGDSTNDGSIDFTPNDTTNDTPNDIQSDDPNGCVNNATRCSGTNLETCVNNTWMVSMVCPNGCAAGECVPDTMTGTCDMPLPLSVGQTVVGTTQSVYNLNTWDNVCTQDYGYNTLGTETVYELTVNTMQVLEFEVIGLDQVHFGLYMRSDCTSTSSQVHSACDGTTSPGGRFTTKTILGPGTYYVFVDSFENEETGRFQLTVRQSVVEACEDQIPQFIDITGGSQTVMGDTSDGLNSSQWLQQACPNDAIDSIGKEKVYAFAMNQPGNIQISVTPTNPVDSQLGIYIRSDCNDRFSQIGQPENDGCGYTAGNTAAVINTELDAGAYFLFVDDFAGSIDDPQEYRINITGP